MIEHRPVSNRAGAAAWLFEAVWWVFDTTTLVDVTSAEYVGVYNVLFGVAIFGAIATNVIAAGHGEQDYATIVSASTWVFVAVAVVALGTLLAALTMPRGSVDSPAYSSAPAMEAER